MREERIQLLQTIFQRERTAEQNEVSLWIYLSNPIYYFIEMVLSSRRRKQMAACSQHALDLADRLRSVRDVIQHVIGDHRVERFVRKRDPLRVDLFELEGASSDDQIPPCRIKHPRRKIREGDVPASGDTAYVFLPQICRSATKFQKFCVGGHVEEAVKDPVHPAIRVRAEALMERDARIEVGRIFVLISF